MSFLEKKKIIIIRKYIDNLQLRNEVKYRLKKKQKKKWETGKGDRHEIRSIRATLTVIVNTKLRRGLTSPIRKHISIPCSCDFSGSPRAKRKRVVYEEPVGWHWPQVGVLLSFHFYLAFRTHEFVIYLTIKWHGGHDLIICIRSKYV